MNILSHQKAAYAMLLELYEVDSVMDTEVRRKILSWYARFDLFAGLMSGYETVLGREWFCANENYYRSQSQKYPHRIDYRIEAAVAGHRVTAMDMASLFAKLPRGDITIETFITENEILSEQIKAWKHNFDPFLTDASCLVDPFEGGCDPGLDGIVDPYMRGGMYRGALWPVNSILMDWLAVDMMHRQQTALMLEQQPPPELELMALEMCRLFEAIETWPGSPPGSVLRAQANLAIACVYLPKTERHVTWCRTKLAKIEGMGYGRDT